LYIKSKMNNINATKSSLKLDFDALPLGDEFTDEGRPGVQLAFNKMYGSLTKNQQVEVEKLVTKKSFNKDDT